MLTDCGVIEQYGSLEASDSNSTVDEAFVVKFVAGDNSGLFSGVFGEVVEKDLPADGKEGNGFEVGSVVGVVNSCFAVENVVRDADNAVVNYPKHLIVALDHADYYSVVNDGFGSTAERDAVTDGHS